MLNRSGKIKFKEKNIKQGTNLIGQMRKKFTKRIKKCTEWLALTELLMVSVFFLYITAKKKGAAFATPVITTL